MSTEKKDENENRGGKLRVRWLPYTTDEQHILGQKLRGEWSNLDFLKDIWTPVYDDRDVLQYTRLANSWRLRERGLSFSSIGRNLGLDGGKVCALVSGKNCRPYLAQMYLNREMLRPPRDGWKWILQTTPKPTNPYPRAIEAPAQITSYSDITEFLRQFPPLREDDPNIKFFGLTSEWVEKHKPELFSFLVAFLVGDGGKSYPEYEYRSRHYQKTAMTTNMAWRPSNFRVLRYVQLALQVVGIQSHQIESDDTVIRWYSETSNLITWILRVCIGLKEGERTSYNPVNMPWLNTCPKEFIVAFLQGLADSDGYVHKTRNYTEISSIPNATFYRTLFASIGIQAKNYPLDNPKVVRIDLQTALHIPLFNEIISSYRQQQLIQRLPEQSHSSPPYFFICSYIGSETESMIL